MRTYKVFRGLSGLRLFLYLYSVLQLTLFFSPKYSYASELPSTVIGMYEWSTQNLNVKHFRNGESIPEAKTDSEWNMAAQNGTPAWCYYNNDPTNGEKYGVLYNWFAVNDPRGIAPEGWNIPGREEVQSLISELGEGGGATLKGKYGWPSKESDKRGFNALPAGVRSIGGFFHDKGKYANFWSTTSKNSDNSLYFSLGHKHDNIDTTGIFNFLRKGAGMSVRCVKRVSYSQEFKVLPDNVPNEGLMFVDHESRNRSGHYGSALTTCKNGDIIAFYTNVSGSIFNGHGIAGWSEYKRSTDGGKTWGEPVVLEYSKRMWDLNNVANDKLNPGQLYVASFVRAVITAPNGTLIAHLSRQMGSARDNYDGFKTPVYILSYDNGKTWTEPREVDEIASPKQLSLTNDDGASFVYDGVIYTVFIGEYGTGEYCLYASKDNGESFSKISQGLFKHRKHKSNYYYMTAQALDDGRIVVYSYNMDDEHHFPYVVSSDEGRTWSDVRTTYMAKRVRDAQMSEKVGDYYFMVGRSGSFGNDPMNLVLYASTNGIEWDNGKYLKKIQKTLDSYSAIEVVRGNGKTRSSKVLIQASVGYGVGSNVNVKHWWVENIK
ncbi:FISUMP domain-containing protein [uncultured Arcticibacterium sp.]|uniref:FISUMP domain-containing protein n=1 Tax=uncultured Arcticibacterium sp. TaxID=2173042 RepID=UPI0030F8615C